MTQEMIRKMKEIIEKMREMIKKGDSEITLDETDDEEVG